MNEWLDGWLNENNKTSLLLLLLLLDMWFIRRSLYSCRCSPCIHLQWKKNHRTMMLICVCGIISNTSRSFKEIFLKKKLWILFLCLMRTSTLMIIIMIMKCCKEAYFFRETTVSFQDQKKNHCSTGNLYVQSDSFNVERILFYFIYIFIFIIKFFFAFIIPVCH